MWFQRFFKIMSHDMAIDLGTANTVVYVRGRGIVLNEPSVVAIETINGVQRVKAVGEDAKMMMGKTPDAIQAIRPLRDGVIADIDVAEQMIKHFITKVHGQRRFPRWPEIVICVPSGSTKVERRAIRDAASNAGASQVWLIEEPMAAAIGAGLPVGSAQGSMIVDIGGGTTEVAVTSLGGIVVARSIRVAGDEMNEDIINYAKQKYNLLIGEQMSEKIKIEAGSAYPLEQEKVITLRGRNLVSGLPDSIDVSSVELREALKNSVSIIVDTVRQAIDETPPELISDLMEHGIALAGGGALLDGLAKRLSEETRMHVYVAENPLSCVARGAGQVLENFETLHEALASMQRGSTLH